ncbi:hypothetical protein TTHERM_00849470 (macronuclear) [Tetrahymena thermophila SB210]|uniref:Uncharacterized protein n=1 Tax=Tetrahymena thermophila (strain SB210) TaxID=312017 RepID=Q23R37_TETTS|nr:hypothetical protein TTHERM_00849470 [Tetrahymena thermophila SB210]EAR99004.2 hypothetical protein TTHERM_00849470 [Tetrahymena thermophila SB210]|eukprot:XP_001019249.2 hypothetical protein TTHERM_00849470 [Tetrahymena thermophila SB210]
MGFKIRETSTSVKRRKNKEKKFFEKLNGNQVNSILQSQNNLPEKNIESVVQSDQKQLKFQENVEKAKEKNVQQDQEDINILVNSHTLIGSISYEEKQDSLTQKQSLTIQSIELSNKPIEQQVLEYYQDKIDKLDVRQTLKSYLRRTLDTIILSNENDKIFLLEIRKQLKQSQRIAKKQEYSDFLKLVDNLYLLAVDKCITQIFQGAAATRGFSDSSSSSLDNQQIYESSTLSPNTNDQLGEHNPNPGSLIDNILRLHNNNSSDIIRILQRNALQRLAQAYRRVTGNSYNNLSRQQSIINRSPLYSNRQNQQYQQQQGINNYESNSSIESNSRRTNIGSWSNYEDNGLGSSFFTSTLRSHIDNESQTTNASSSSRNNNNNFNSILYNNLEGQELDDDTVITTNSSQNENSQRRLTTSQSNSNLLMIGSGRYFGFRSISSQVAANQGDTSIQTSSETGSNFSS